MLHHATFDPVAPVKQATVAAAVFREFWIEKASGLKTVSIRLISSKEASRIDYNLID
jgi:hypothetical protein